MPKRKETYRVDSAEVQGKGSWVELRYLTYAEMQTSLKGEGDDAKLLTEHTVAWNWVDSKGKPFGDPQDCIEDLFMSERWFILGKLFNPSEAAKAKN